MLNLIADSWIPVRRKDGSRAVIAPWQVADADLAFPDWPRPDLNIACLELLAGLVFLSDPPTDPEDWEDRAAPHPERLRAALAPSAPAFELLGDGPRFMQDLEKLEEQDSEANPPDMLFMDSAGGQTIRNNADLLVKRGRYPALPPALAAMALYTLQAHAPAGGAGIRTSMRGGGPMVTLVDPGRGLWALIWANVPYGRADQASALPWMRPTRVSVDEGSQVYPDAARPVEAFFGMPRRLRLVADKDAVTGVVQKPRGTNYAGWEHPLTPHYRMKRGSELLPRHPRAGAFGYRNWLGITARHRSDDDTARWAQVLGLWDGRSREQGRDGARVLVAGWAMDNMKPRDFVYSRAPLIDLPPERAELMEGMVEAAEALAVALRGALIPILAEGEAREATREAFFIETQAAFEARLAALAAGAADIPVSWLADLRSVALRLFDGVAMPGFAERDVKVQASLIQARRNLSRAFAGYGKQGREAYEHLGLPVPEQKKGRSA